MGFFSVFYNWQVQRYEKHKSEMQSLGKCPDCRGKGMISVAPAFNDVYISPYECSNCNGSGLYSEWIGRT